MTGAYLMTSPMHCDHRASSSNPVTAVPLHCKPIFGSCNQSSVLLACTPNKELAQNAGNKMHIANYKLASRSCLVCRPVQECVQTCLTSCSLLAQSMLAPRSMANAYWMPKASVDSSKYGKITSAKAVSCTCAPQAVRCEDGECAHNVWK